MEETKITHRKSRQRAKATLQDPAREHKEIIQTLLKTFTHFFGPIGKRLGTLSDSRSTEKTNGVKYTIETLVFTGILMFICRLGARRQVRLLLHTVYLAQTFDKLFGVSDVPHGDTMNAVFVNTSVDQVQEIVTGMTEVLIDKKVLYPHRLLERYYVCAVDATGMLVYDHPHCPYCLSKKHGDNTLYYHYVLEAKIVTPDGMAFSLMSEFIENPEDDPTKSLEQRKQDCETKAFYRLAERLHNRFPKLPLLLTMDGLYATGPVFSICERYHWKFMICLSDDQLRSVNEEFEALCAAEPDNRLSCAYGQDGNRRQQFRWVNDILYTDSRHNEHRLQVLECKDVRPDEHGAEKTTKFKWISNISIKCNNISRLANEGGRIRWKIENEGFNVQKTGGYNLEHAYSNDENAIKIYYLILQIAHMLTQLIEKGSLLRNAFPKGFGSVKNLAFRILEALRNATLTDDEYQTMTDQRIQIRFTPP